MADDNVDGLHDVDYSSNVVYKKVNAQVLKQYEIEYDKVMKHTELVNLFQRHLKKEYNTEPLECCIEINKFVHMVSSNNVEQHQQDWKTLGDHIVDTYLKSGAMKEVNIPATIKSQCLKNWSVCKEEKEQSQLEQLKQNLFKEVLFTLNTSLKIDSFPRFIRSNEFRKYMALNGLPLLNKIATHLSITTKNNYSWNESDFVLYNMTERHVHLARMLAADAPRWELMGYSPKRGKDQCVCYICTEDYYPGMLSSKAIGYYNYSVEEMMFTLDQNKYLLKMIPAITKTHVHEMLAPSPENGRDYHTALKHYIYKFGPLLKERECLCVETALYDKDKGEYLVIKKSCQHPDYPERKDKIRMNYYGVKLITRVGHNLTRVIEVGLCGLGGYMNNKTIYRLSLIQASEGYHKLTRQLMKTAVDKGEKLSDFPVNEQDYGSNLSLMKRNLPQ